MNITSIVGIALAISLLGNIALGKLLQGAYEDKATAQSQREQAVASAKSCSDGVVVLENAAKEREAKAKEAIRKAQEAAKSAQQRALRTMSVSASDPNDLCASSLVLSRQKIKERRQ